MDSGDIVKRAISDTSCKKHHMSALINISKTIIFIQKCQKYNSCHITLLSRRSLKITSGDNVVGFDMIGHICTVHDKQHCFILLSCRGPRLNAQLTIESL
jgi:hypothetical protein